MPAQRALGQGLHERSADGAHRLRLSTAQAAPARSRRRSAECQLRSRSSTAWDSSAKGCCASAGTSAGEIQDSAFLGLLAHEWRGDGGSMTRSRSSRSAPQLAADFRRLNLDWIERLFTVEAPDRKVLDDPERAIIAPGGMIFFAMDGDAVVGTVAMIRVRRGRYELAKMAVATSHQRRGIGELLGAAGMAWAQRARRRTRLSRDQQPARQRDPPLRAARLPPRRRSRIRRITRAPTSTWNCQFDPGAEVE